VSLNRYIAKKIERDEITNEYLEKAYEDNLRLVLKVVKKMVNEMKLIGKVVLTSDHGELLGENGFYMHPSYLNLPEQRIVP